MLVGELESFSPAPARASQHMTLGTNAAAAFRIRTARAWDMETFYEQERPATAASHWPMGDFYDEKYNSALRSRSSLDGFETSCTLRPLDEPEYLFGGSERPKSITDFDKQD
ncbi:hypothetical protein NXS19_012689 [Fusarium pseudograminearum]|nr:hypothetical protein NXS19_012689 [Fusarium pseudograminearum]